MRLNKRAIVVSTAALVIIGGSAFAYVTGTLSGQASASSGNEARRATIITGTITGDLRDDDGVAIPVWAQNATGSSLQVTAAAPASWTITDGTGACSPATFRATQFAMDTSGLTTTGTFTVPKYGNAGLGTIKVAAVNPATTELSGCAGATVTINWP
jgi:hypothetical protein